MIMKLGVTGSRNGMTVPQRVWFAGTITGNFDLEEFHHGDCIGVDDQARRLIIHYRRQTLTVAHPPINDRYQAHGYSDIVLEPKEYLERDRDIVLATDLLIGFPDSDKERVKSGTWYTIRFARHQKTPLIVVGPGGNVIETSALDGEAVLL